MNAEGFAFFRWVSLHDWAHDFKGWTCPGCRCDWWQLQTAKSKRE